jgi:hypothetical protein
MRDIRVANAMKNAPEARITRVAPGVRSALLSMGYFWSVLYDLSAPHSFLASTKSFRKIRLRKKNNKSCTSATSVRFIISQNCSAIRKGGIFHLRRSICGT